MTKQNEVYKCEVCGNIVEVLHEGAGTLVCCGQNMHLQEEKTQDPEKGEKHLPIITKTEKGFLVKVGSIEHPMEEKHYIEFIEVIADGKLYKKFLKPGDKPEAEFCIQAENIIAREYCNLHGLWKSEQ
jgi:superoxide reductase